MTDSPLDLRRDQLKRLRMFTDVSFAVALVLLVEGLPLPSGEDVWLGELFAEQLSGLLAAVVGLVFIIIYWLRSNVLLTSVARTDLTHTALSIAHLFFIVMLLWVVSVSTQVAEPSQRAGQSLAILLAGLTAGGAWYWARRKSMVVDDITPKQQEQIQVEAYAEPIAAIVTLPLAYVGPVAWELGWLAYIPIAVLLRRRERRRLHT